jgi:NCS2 family nucleobase:cation symporter-2
LKKPSNIAYGVNDVPPLGVIVLSGVQHVGIIAASLVYPVLYTRAAGLPAHASTDVLSLAMLALGLSAILQALPRGAVGSHYLCPPIVTAAYFPATLLAIKAGGLALAFGMTLFAGFVEVLLSRVLRPLRPYFPPEISGFVVVMVSIAVGSAGLRNVLGVSTAEAFSGIALAVGAVTLGTMVVLSVWTRGATRFFCALIGMVVGYGMAVATGIIKATDLITDGSTPLFHLPTVANFGWSFEVTIVIPFVAAAVASTIRTMGDVTTSQKLNDADWARPDMRSVSGGVLANGLSNITAGIIGTAAVSTATSGVGTAAATGVLSRRVAYVIGAAFFILAFFPRASAILLIMPGAVIGAVLLFSASFIFVNGIQIIASRMLDARRTFVIGLSFMVGLASDLYPALRAEVPAKLLPLFSSSLILGTISALLLNALFRFGVRKDQMLIVEQASVNPEKIEEFIETQGATWGARKDVIDRAKFNLTQSIETIVDGCSPQSSLEIKASFDEFSLDVRVSYAGVPLELPEKRPTNEEIMESEEGQRRLAGFMLRRYADHVAVIHKAGRSTILFQFDH